MFHNPVRGVDAVGVMVMASAVAVLVTALFRRIAPIRHRLVRLRNHTHPSWARIDVRLKRRHDLIPGV